MSQILVILHAVRGGEAQWYEKTRVHPRHIKFSEHYVISIFFKFGIISPTSYIKAIQTLMCTPSYQQDNTHPLIYTLRYIFNL